MTVDDLARERAKLTRQIQQACSPSGGAFAVCPADGSERAMLVAFSVLHGIVNEFLDEGDEAAALLALEEAV